MATAAAPFDGRTEETDDAKWQGPLFVITIFVGSFLLFLVQPMVARMALPRLGGAPAVWNSAMLVYQALLLGGYAYAHAIGRFPVLRQALIHIALLAVAAIWLPIGLAAIYPSPSASPALWTPYLLALSIGPLFFAVSAQAPLIQRWYAAASGGRDPYALYAASNLGSFGGLIAYPLLVEPQFALADQSRVWSFGYGVLALLVIGCALLLPRGEETRAETVTSDPPPLSRKLWWVLLAFVPSGLMLSTTTYITTDVVAMPLLWVLPLGLYLLSFSVAFAARRGAAEMIGRLSPIILVTCGAISIRNDPTVAMLSAGASLLLLFAVSVALHGAMYRLRPAADRLTGFYLLMSVGGVLGGIFAALVAPLLFDWTYEHPLLIFLAGALVPLVSPFPAIGRLWRDERRATALTAAIALAVLVCAYLGIDRPWRWLWQDGTTYAAMAIGAITLFAMGRRIPFLIGLGGLILVLGVWQSFELSAVPGARSRSYFGVYTIREFPENGIRTLAHGTTYHGLQILKPGHETEPTSYYGPRSGVGQALLALPAIAGPAARVGIVGLGTGTLACYKRPGQRWTYFEIDPTVVRIARNSGKFSFLSRCAPDVSIAVGDARLTLARRPAGALDLLALDAFSSDVVPMHLLTHEAFETYARALAPGGVLLVHISNRFLDLEPVIAEAARNGGWTAALMHDVVDEKSAASVYLNTSVWVALSRDKTALGRIVARAPLDGEDWRPLHPRPQFRAWTDDFSSILPLVNAWKPKAGAK